jgi:hypothetical protein
VFGRGWIVGVVSAVEQQCLGEILLLQHFRHGQHNQPFPGAIGAA